MDDGNKCKRYNTRIETKPSILVVSRIVKSSVDVNHNTFLGQDCGQNLKHITTQYLQLMKKCNIICLHIIAVFEMGKISSF